jgi:hypothetical protein
LRLAFFERMIERMTKATEAIDWIELACRRARAYGRRRAGGSTEWPPFQPSVALSEGPLGAVQAADREIAHQTAVRAKAVAKFAASRPATADRGQGEPGAMSPERWAVRPDVLRSVSEWAAQELVVALSISTQAAESLLERSLTLVHRLPGTLAALEAGALHPGHLWPMLDKVAPIEDDEVRAEVEAELLRWAARRVTTPAQLGAKARREVLRRGARSAARDLEKAIRKRGVHLHAGLTDGMAAVTSLLTLPEARLLVQALEAYADAVPDDPEKPRSRQQKMADCLLDLVLRPGETDAPSVQLVLTVVASMATLAGGDEPGEVEGHVVPAAMVRELLRRIAGRPSAPDAVSAGEEPETDDAIGPGIVEPAVADGSPSFDGTRAAGPDPTGATCPSPSPDAAEMRTDVDDEENERWWAEVERQVLAEELGLTPEHPPEGVIPTPARADADPEEGQPGPSGPVAAGDAGPPHEATAPADGHDWWRTADAAVAQAGQSLLDVMQGLSHARRLVRAARVADDADEASWKAGPGGRVAKAEDAFAVLDRCTDEQRAWLADLLAMTGGGGLVDRPRIALTDALSGTLLALTDLSELRRVGTCGARTCRREPGRCDHDLRGRPGLTPPGPTNGYRPGAALDRWVRARDRRCRFPGCRRRVPRGGELDHDQPYPLGPTSAENLVGYCTGHHRGKHQAPGWQHSLGPDGTLTVTTPTGLTATTDPPPF